MDADYLRYSVARMYHRRDPLATKNPSSNPPKIPRGFIMVNLSAREQKELRSLARQNGMDLRGLIRYAIGSQVRHELETAARVNASQAWIWSAIWFDGHHATKSTTRRPAHPGRRTTTKETS